MKNPTDKDNAKQHSPLFNDPQRRKRYICSLIMILLMIGVAELLHEKEVLFPEMAALTIGMWIVDKRVWKVKYWQMLLLMTFGACAGVLVVLYSPFVLVINVALAFLCAAIGLFIARASLFHDFRLRTSGIIGNRKLGLSVIRFCDDIDYHCRPTMDGTSWDT